MVRAVTADHVMFKECIAIFRADNEHLPEEEKMNDKELTSYVLLDFELRQTWDFKDFVIKPTHQIRLPRAYSAFIAPVTLPKRLVRHNSHLFTIAISAI
ncbi:MAG: hypothetical protein CVV03_07625 [Firmicutes bacterium HGW-Firmicutes-8]|nr:MAG: hypothetical protein CVV03_07625 [Firmicutes bacterium HGW-Firmicutes-8]